MKFFQLEPEVAGGFGDNTVIEDTAARPLRIQRLEYRFDGWLGDDLLETVGCFIATPPLAKAIQLAHSTGVDFADVEVSKSPEFEELYPNLQIPTFVWLKVFGKAGSDDFGLSKENKLVVSELAFNVLQLFALRHCEVAEY